VGIVTVWNMDDILRTIARSRRSQYASFGYFLSEKPKRGFEIQSPRQKIYRLCPKSAEASPEQPQIFDSEISISPIEILNCTFHPKPLYQRYIQVVLRASSEAVVSR
jgi:hypothetical protein